MNSNGGEKLNPCAWCGNDKGNQTLRDEYSDWFVWCRECGTTGPRDSKKAAAKAKWNAAPIAALDALRLQLSKEANDAIAKVTAEKDAEIATATRERGDARRELAEAETILGIVESRTSPEMALTINRFLARHGTDDERGNP